MMRSLNFANLGLDLAGGIKDRSAIAFDSGFAESNAQTRQADSTQQLALKPKNWNRQSSNVRITFAKAEIIPCLSDVGSLFALPDRIGIQYLARRAYAQWKDLAFFDMVPRKPVRIDTVEAKLQNCRAARKTTRFPPLYSPGLPALDVQ